MGSQKVYPEAGIPWVQDGRWQSQDLRKQDDVSKEWECYESSNGNLNKRMEYTDRLPYTDSAFGSDCSSSSSSSNSSCCYTDGVGTTTILIQTSRDDDRFPSEKWKTILAFLCYLITLVLNLISLAIIHDRVPRGSPLPDKVFSLLPRIEEAQVVSEAIISISTLVLLLLLCLLKHRFIILRRVFVILSLLYLTRSLTIFVTQLPVSKETRICAPTSNSTSVMLIVQRVTVMLGGFGMSTTGKHVCCGDYMFSGHTVTLTLCYLFISEYTPSRWYILHRMSWVASATGIVCLILSQGHYTIDVLVAYYITTRTFWIYHTLANNQIPKNMGRTHYVSRVWWFFVFRFFEKNVNGVVPLEQEWPLPWPRSWTRKAWKS